MDSKTWYTSKTIWFNVLTGVLTCVVGLQDSKVFTDPQVVAAIGSIVTVVNIVLRLITSQPVTAKKPD